MHRIQTTLIELAAAAVFIVPLFCVLGKFVFHSVKRTVLYTVFAFYLTAVLVLVGFPAITNLTFDPFVNLIPFADMMHDIKNALLNVLLFIPLGLFLPILWNKYRNIKNTVIFGLGMTVFVESAQIFTFRTTDINDIITNAAGTALGFLAAELLTKKFKRYTVFDSKDKELYIICTTVSFVMLFAEPFVSPLLWKMIL